jgi:hypothetical protein
MLPLDRFIPSNIHVRFMSQLIDPFQLLIVLIRKSLPLQLSVRIGSNSRFFFIIAFCVGIDGKLRFVFNVEASHAEVNVSAIDKSLAVFLDWCV